MKRRDFLRAAALSTAALAARSGWSPIPADETGPPSSNPASLPRREYGKTGIRLSAVAFGGLALKGMEQDHANRLVAEAVERGVNYFDVAPSYGDAEAVLGPALEPYRRNVFLACKTRARDRDGAAAELERSLEHLRTDYFDLYQLHAITDVDKDVKAAFAQGGAMESILAARKEGRIRHLGFSAHSEEAALAAMELFDFDSLLFPINFACYYKGDFGPRVLEKAQQKGVAVVSLKSLVRQKWPKDAPDRKEWSRVWYQPATEMDEADLAVRWALSRPIVAVLPPADERLHRLAFDIGMKLRPITPEEETTAKAWAEEMNPLFSRV